MTLAYLGSSTLVSVMLLSIVLVQVLVSTSVFLLVSMTVVSEPVTEDVRLVLTAGSGGESELTPSGADFCSEECCWVRLLYSEQT